MTYCPLIKKKNEIKFKNKMQNNVTDDLKKSLINYIIFFIQTFN